MCRIVADAHEIASGVPALLRSRGADVVVSRLPVADYDLGCGVLVERKAVADFHDSLVRGRLWPQLGRLRATARVGCLLIEGRSLDGVLSGTSVRATVLAVSDLGVLVIRSSSRQDSADWLVSLVRRGGQPVAHRVRPAYAQRSQPVGDDIPQAMLAAVPGISTQTARSLLRAFGSVANVLAASDNELCKVRGIGQQRLRALRDASSSVLPP